MNHFFTLNFTRHCEGGWRHAVPTHCGQPSLPRPHAAGPCILTQSISSSIAIVTSSVTSTQSKSTIWTLFFLGKCLMVVDQAVGGGSILLWGRVHHRHYRFDSGSMVGSAVGWFPGQICRSCGAQCGQQVCLGFGKEPCLPWAQQKYLHHVPIHKELLGWGEHQEEQSYEFRAKVGEYQEEQSIVVQYNLWRTKAHSWAMFG